jgi:hypothetical protein
MRIGEPGINISGQSGFFEVLQSLFIAVLIHLYRTNFPSGFV